MKKYLYMGHARGEFEGVQYDSISLSDGKRTAKAKNATGKKEFSDLKPEIDYVNVEFEVVPSKGEQFRARVAKMEKVK